MIQPCGAYARCPFVSEDKLTLVGDDKNAVWNKTARENVTIKTTTVIGKAELTTFELEPIFVKTQAESSLLPSEQVHRIEAVNLDHYL